MIIAEQDFTQQEYEKLHAEWFRQLFGNEKEPIPEPENKKQLKELARPGPKSAAQTPAPPKERIKGSKENPEGTAATRSKAGDIEISEANEQALKDKIAQFKKDHPKKNAPSLGTLKKVFRRGAGAYSTSFRPTISGGRPNSRNAWAMARVNKFLKMAGGGEVKESYRKADGDLLEERFEDCGTGAGGFKEGNTCAKAEGAINESKSVNNKKIFISQKGSFLKAETDGGIVGGNIKDGAIKISIAELKKEMRGRGIGKAMYSSLIDEAHKQGLRVYSDTTVEIPSVRVYQALGKDGYNIITNNHGVLSADQAPPLGAWFGYNDKPVFEIRPKKI